MKWRMAMMVVLSFALHGWLLWATPAQEVSAPSGVVALKLGQVKLASVAAQQKSVEQPKAKVNAREKTNPATPPSKPVESVPPKPVKEKHAGKLLAEGKPTEQKSAPQETIASPMPVSMAEQRPAPMQEDVAHSESSQQSSTLEPAKPQSVSEEPVLVERPAFASPPSAPDYPALAWQRRQQGTVVVEVQLDHTGAQTVRRLLQSSGIDSLDEAALNAVEGWKFLPYRENGRARLSRVRLPIRFSL